MIKMPKLLIVSDHIGQDGTGRFLTYLANSLTESKKIKVSLMLFHEEKSTFNNFLNPNVDVIRLAMKGRIQMSILFILREIIKQKPDYCLFGYTQLLLLGYLTPLLNKSGIKVLFRDTIIPSLFHRNDSRVKLFFNRKAYHCFNQIIAQSDDMKNDLVNNWGCCEKKVLKINNPVDISAVQQRARGKEPEELLNKTTFTFVAAGRLTYQKGYDIIIQRMAELRPAIPFRLYILGKGEDREKLYGLIDYYGLHDYIKLLGFRSNVPLYIKHSDALLLSSRYEGFPNIVLESLALGKPVFTNNCPGGINEIIKDGINGVSCDFSKHDDFVSGLKRFINGKYDETLIMEDTKKRFSLNTIMLHYENIFS